MEGLTVPQYRALSFINRHPDASLNDVASHLGLTAPSTSKLVQKLVIQKVIRRRTGEDRRRICLSLTEQGAGAFKKARLETQQQLAEELGRLSDEDIALISNALSMLSKAFADRKHHADIR
jgi:DNA-binding MarR family transcriptional regulator